MLTDNNEEDLKVMGYTVVTEVLTSEECDESIDQYKKWLSEFKEGDWPIISHSLIKRYNVGHMHPTWFVRLKSKKVFAQIWHTDKLLTSVDAIAIGRPPEDGKEKFHRPGQHWLHVDQGAHREGLHAYQGAVYLENADEDDWTFEVMEGSHSFFEEFYKNNEKAVTRTVEYEYYLFKDADIDFMKKRGCKLKRVAVPKGGMVLWDSRVVHANANPIKGRKHPGRWRYCIFVSMTPAIWASSEDMMKKQDAYDTASMTTHWSSQKIRFFLSSFAEGQRGLPKIAKSRDAKLLSGAISYDFNDGQPNGDEHIPCWKNNIYKPRILQHVPSYRLYKLITLTGVVAIASWMYLKFVRQ